MSNSPLNQFFAKVVLKDGYTEEQAQFLEEVMQTSREGYLSLERFNAPALPDWVLDEGKEKFPKKPIVRHKNRYYLQKNWVLESHILEEIARLKSLNLPKILSSELPTLLPMQKKAVLNVFENSFSIICGGPGTGKTYTASILIQCFIEKKPKAKVVIAAPTGKAASHFATILKSNVEATTLHRLLKITPGQHRLFSDWKIDADLVIVDEASMLDVTLLAKLLESIGNETRLVLIGDPDQLPPVEMGSVFKELADRFGIRLEKSMRTENRDLQEIAEKVNLGEWTDKIPLLNWSFNHQLVEKLYEKINPIFSYEKPDPEKSLKRLDEFRILGALRQGPFGTDALNQNILKEIARNCRPNQWWVIPIMIQSNHPDQDLYNGTCGCLIGQARGEMHLSEGIAYFPNPVPYKMLPPFEVAFCLSIHKSQGSEFEKVLALFPEGSENFGKEAIYTAVTRAKHKIEIVGEESILKKMLAKCLCRTSGLSDRITI